VSDSTPSPDRRPRPAKKPKKPYPDFPLTPHACGAWQKKIRGRTHYFGRWARMVNGVLTRVDGDGWREALEAYQRVADDLHAGRAPSYVDWDSLTVAELCNRFLTDKLRKVEAGEIGRRRFEDVRAVTDVIVSTFGRLRPVKELVADDFGKLRQRLAERVGPVKLGVIIGIVRSVFRYGDQNGLLDRPVRYGSQFAKPDKAVLRRHRAAAGPKMLEADQVRALVGAADVALRPTILLGVNCGFGNMDCATLPLAAVNLETGWVDFPRPKTGINRRCALWPETVAAIREALAARPEPKDRADAGLALLQQSGRRWARDTEKGSHSDNLSVLFRGLLKRLGLYRPGLSFYALRHVFRTVADAARDPVAIDLIMGHTDPSMAGRYRERVDDARLVAVADVVHAWLFGDDAKGPADEPDDVPPEAPAADDPAPDGGPWVLRLFAG
jgi:integrase